MTADRLLQAQSFGRLVEEDVRILERGFVAIERAYGQLLDIALRFRLIVWVMFLASVVAAGWMAVRMPKGFFPIEDTGLLSVSTEGPRGASIALMGEKQNQIAEIFMRSPHVSSVVASVGAVGGSASINQGRLFVELKPRNQRPPVEQVIRIRTGETDESAV
jgi:HAE1 family hydrophobic/amphiphilic exporter-1